MSLDGQPYEETGKNCWWLVQHVQRRLFGRILPLGPAVLPAPGSERARLLRDGVRSSGWRRFDTPLDGDLVLMSRVAVGAHTHCGVYLADRLGVIHTDAGHGTVIDSLVDLRHVRFWHPDFYRPVPPEPR